jgi:hypothetical protein
MLDFLTPADATRAYTDVQAAFSVCSKWALKETGNDRTNKRRATNRWDYPRALRSAVTRAFASGAGDAGGGVVRNAENPNS